MSSGLSTNCLQIIYLIYMYKEDLGLNNLQCHKIQPNPTQPNQTKPNIDVKHKGLIEKF